MSDIFIPALTTNESIFLIYSVSDKEMRLCDKILNCRFLGYLGASLAQVD